MKALLRCGAGLVSLLLLANITHGYVWVTPVYKCPYGQAPSPSNTWYYVMDAQGRWTGPHYYVVPPFPPFNGMLPGKTGNAIKSGYLPHTLLMSKEGLVLGNAANPGQPMPYPGQAPQMQYPGQAPPPPPQNAYPVHPFTRSPRDFFMWGENMEDEQRMRNRPFPVPR